MQVLLLSTLESRQLKKEGVITIDRYGETLTVEYDKASKKAVVVSRVLKPLVFVNPYITKYDVKLTQAEAKTYAENGIVEIVRANNTFILKDDVLTLASTNNYDYVLVR